MSMTALTFMTAEDIAAVELAHTEQQQCLCKELRKLEDN